MTESASVEDRLAVLEREITELKRQVASDRPSGEWFRRVAGSFKNEAEFGEVLRLGREIRQADRPDGEP